MIILMLIEIIIGAIIINYIINLIVKYPGNELQRKFQSLGDMTGLSKATIIAKCGNFNSTSYVGDGTLCQWLIPPYHIAIVFDINDKVVGITHESF